MARIDYENGYYIGDVENGLPNGIGSLILDGQEQAGEFKDGWLVSGVLSFADGTKQTGEFYQGRLHGEGSLETADGLTMSGEFSHGRIGGVGYWDQPGGKQFDCEYVWQSNCNLKIYRYENGCRGNVEIEFIYVYDNDGALTHTISTSDNFATVEIVETDPLTGASVIRSFKAVN